MVEAQEQGTRRRSRFRSVAYTALGFGLGYIASVTVGDLPVFRDILDMASNGREWVPDVLALTTIGTAYAAPIVGMYDKNPEHRLGNSLMGTGISAVSLAAIAMAAGVHLDASAYPLHHMYDGSPAFEIVGARESLYNFFENAHLTGAWLPALNATGGLLSLLGGALYRFAGLRHVARGGAKVGELGARGVGYGVSSTFRGLGRLGSWSYNKLQSREAEKKAQKEAAKYELINPKDLKKLQKRNVELAALAAQLGTNAQLKAQIAQAGVQLADDPLVLDQLVASGIVRVQEPEQAAQPEDGEQPTSRGWGQRFYDSIGIRLGFTQEAPVAVTEQAAQPEDGEEDYDFEF